MSVLEKLDVIPGLVSVLTKTLFAFVFGPFKSRKSRPKSYYRYVMLTAMRTTMARLNVRQQHYISTPGDDVYLALCKKHKLTPQSEILEDGTRAHWIGEKGKEAENLIINFHDVGKAGKERLLPLPILRSRTHSPVSETTTASFLANESRLAQPIILTGDSAGANLVMALLSHITHPHPGLGGIQIPKVEFEGSFKGVVLTSPWVSFEVTSDSFQENEPKDVVSISAGKKWSTSFLGTPWPHATAVDAYNQPAGNAVPVSWFEDFPKIVDEVLIVCGSDEVMVDGIRDFKKKLAKGMGEDRVKFFVGENEYHDQPSLDLGIGYKESEEGMQAKEIKRWIASKL
ncbi:related to triacylglycerol lipase 2 [Phialocephala subalpina]|uniref:Related to triacylglycerol lipase 2 n=1 Tax=Phialocephala subalpina TaxID=576137 RepID=A0A1L7X2V7_9HELO|nr:related to triacylglycerol lipase 2 [Phialocephala subalpina]